MKLNLVNICLSIFFVFLIVFFLLLPHFRESKIEAFNPRKYARNGDDFEYLWSEKEGSYVENVDKNLLGELESHMDRISIRDFEGAKEVNSKPPLSHLSIADGTKWNNKLLTSQDITLGPN